MSSEKIDNVNHPSHYETGKYECFDVMREALGDDIVKGFCLGNAFKYIYRTGRKNGLEDIKKAQWYIEHYIQICEGTCEELKCSEGCTDDEECDDIEVDLKDLALYSQMIHDMLDKKMVRK